MNRPRRKNFHSTPKVSVIAVEIVHVCNIDGCSMPVCRNVLSTTFEAWCWVVLGGVGWCWVVLGGVGTLEGCAISSKGGTVTRYGASREKPCFEVLSLPACIDNCLVLLCLLQSTTVDNGVSGELGNNSTKGECMQPHW